MAKPVYFGGQERILSSTMSISSAETEWMNALITEMWPFASQAIIGSIAEILEAALRHNTPPFLPSVEITKVNFGEVPPKVKEVLVRDHRMEKDGEPAKSLVVEVVVEYHGDATIELGLSSARKTTFGISNMNLAGRVEVLMAPLVGQIPLFGAVQVAFLNSPELDYTLTGLAAAGDMGPWADFFREFANSLTEAIAVLPNKAMVKLIPTVDFLDTSEIIEPVGVLRVAVLGGVGFPATDDIFYKRSDEPDVYVKLQIGATRHETARVDDSCNPVFEDQVFDFVLCSNSPNQTLYIHAFDFDIGIDDDLGKAEVPVQALVDASKEDSSFTVRLKNSPMGAIPRLDLMVRSLRMSKDVNRVRSAMVSLFADESRPRGCSTLVLSIAVDRVENLPNKETLKPLVKVFLEGKKVLETWAAFPVAGFIEVHRPEFLVLRHILVQDPIRESTKIEFIVADGTSLLPSSTNLGSAFIHVSDLLAAPRCHKTYDFALIGAQLPRARLRVRMGLLAIVEDQDAPLWQSIRHDRL